MDSCYQPDEFQLPWVYFDEPINVGTNHFRTTNELIFSFEKAVPKEVRARRVKLVLSWTLGCIRSQGRQRVRTRVLDGKINFVHWTYGYSYYQQAVSMTS